MESSLITTVRMTSVKEVKDPSRCQCATLKVRLQCKVCGFSFVSISSLVNIPTTPCVHKNYVNSMNSNVSVHPKDPTRLELIIPGEQHFYVKAVNAAERQRWLVALGSSKAGTLENHKHRGTHGTVNLLCLSLS